MTRTFAIAAMAALIASVALAAEDAQKPAAGGADTSTGAKEQSSAPPGSEAKEDLSAGSTAGTSSEKRCAVGIRARSILSATRTTLRLRIPPRARLPSAILRRAIAHGNFAAGDADVARLDWCTGRSCL